MQKSLQEIVRRTCGRGTGAGDDIAMGERGNDIIDAGGQAANDESAHACRDAA